MISRYFFNLQEALLARKTAQLPGMRPIVAFMVCSTVIYILAALVLVPDDKDREFHFVEEHGAITALSAIFLASSSAFALCSTAVLIRAKDSTLWVWAVLTLGFGFLAFDELLQFHERIGGVLDNTAGAGRFRTWNDIIVILYGVIALPILAAILPGLLRSKWVLEMFVIAFSFYASHTLIDSISEPPTTTSIVLEESCKLFCGAFLATGTFLGFLGLLWNSAILASTTSQQES